MNNNWTKVLIVYLIAMLVAICMSYRADKYFQKGFEAGQKIERENHDR